MTRPAIVTARTPEGAELALALAEIVLIRIHPATHDPADPEWPAVVWLRTVPDPIRIGADDAKLLRAAWLRWSDPA